MKISEVAIKCNTSSSALRYYEKIGLLPEISRQSGQRVYPDSVIWRVNFINAAKAAGFVLSDIKSLLTLADDGQDWRALAQKRLDQIGTEIKTLQVMQKGLEHIIQFECLDDGIARFSQKEEVVTLAMNKSSIKA
ncbi:MerR family DNA-binding protein [Glaciecola sp. KUL10]|uniref:MerR family DNA-binding protein n=1 Tax=Glaciecola sp. (strain KUL10) TaxID=2161813 RepID=UPI000D785522|nr:MerR family DNA-binding protein [Glaciecola sp. KUL10]GBL05695.1 MerR family transcriptional regulator [Glaciecola sp. KUL10]